jgi:hypothetical protein
MGEDALGESLTGSGSSQSGGETEGLRDGQVALDHILGGSLNLDFFLDDTSSLIENGVDTSHHVGGSGNLGQEHRFQKSGFGSQFGGVIDSSGGRDDLSSSSMDGVSVQHHVVEVESDTSHVLVSHGGFLGGPLESRLHGFSDFVQVLNTLGDLDQHVGTGLFGTERPDLLGISLLPIELFLEEFGSFLGVMFGTGGTFFDGVGEFHSDGGGGHVETVVFVGGLGHTDLVGGLLDGFLVSDDGFRLDDFNVCKFFLQVVEADFHVEFTAPGDNVFSGVFGGHQDEGVGLGEFLESFDQLGEILGVFGSDGDSHDGGDGVLHGSDVVGSGGGGDGTGFQEVLIDADQTDGVSAGHVGDVLDGTSHHEHGSLDGLLVEVVFLSGDVVGSLDSDFHAGGDGSGEDTSESEESGLVGGGHHLGDVHHEGTFGVAVLDGHAGFVVLGSFVEVRSSVGLGGLGGGEMEDHHFEDDVGGVEPSGHNDFQ